MQTEKRVPNPPRTCIFCGGRPISKEHIYAEWMRPFLKQRDGLKHELQKFRATTNGHFEEIQNEAGPLNRKGDPRGMGLKVACVSCNNTWMSEMQKSAQKALLPLLHGDFHQLSRAHQRAIACWAAMFTMVWEQADPATAAITQEQLWRFRRERRPPKGWHIWVCQYTGDFHRGSVFHRGIGVLRGNDPVEANRERANAQFTYGAAGRMLFLTFSTTLDDYLVHAAPALRSACRNLGFARVWPPTVSRQPIHGKLDETGFEMLVHYLTRSMELA